MECFVNNLLPFLVIFIFCGDAVAKYAADVKAIDNAEQFALLCRIYNVAKNPPINHVDLPDANKIVNEIDALNASITEKRHINETEQEGNSSDAQVKPTITREAAVAQAILKRITEKAHKILEEIRGVNVTRVIEKVKDEFYQVIFGEWMNESHLCDVVLKSMGNRGTACGKPGAGEKGSHAGKNLVVDFFCLCAMTTGNEGIGNVCGVDIGGNGKKTSDNHGWGTANDPTGSASMWASVKKGCWNLMHQHPKTTQEGHEVLSGFLKHLKSGGVYHCGANNKGSDRKEGMLGTGAVMEGSKGKDIVCDGKRGGKSKPPGGICVYYGTSTEWENIDWLKKFRTALNNVDSLNNKTATMQRDIERLHTLLHRAEQIYETTKVIAEVQNPVQPTNLQTAAKRLTAYNAASSHHPHHFILLFVLLL